MRKITIKEQNKYHAGVGVSELINEKERQFMQKYIPYLEDICDELGMVPCLIGIDDLGLLGDELADVFLKELFRDEEFLNLEVIENFYLADGTEVFCIELMDMYAPCSCCNNVENEWLAIAFNEERNTLDFGIIKCNNSDIVEVSSYRGSKIYEISVLTYYNWWLREMVD